MNVVKVKHCVFFNAAFVHFFNGSDNLPLLRHYRQRAVAQRIDGLDADIPGKTLRQQLFAGARQLSALRGLEHRRRTASARAEISPRDTTSPTSSVTISGMAVAS